MGLLRKMEELDLDKNPKRNEVPLAVAFCKAITPSPRNLKASTINGTFNKRIAKTI